MEAAYMIDSNSKVLIKTDELTNSLMSFTHLYETVIGAGLLQCWPAEMFN